MKFSSKTMISALLAASAFGLTASLPAFAGPAEDAAIYCTGCHNGLTVTGGVVVGGGARSCPQRTAAEWVSTIDRMNGKGCGVPPASVTAIADYLAGGAVTTTAAPTTTTAAATTTTAAATTTTAAATTTTAAATTTTAAPTTTTVATTTTTTSGGGSGASDAAVYCTGCHNGLTVNGVAVGGGARDCPQRSVAEWTSTIDRMNGKGCGVPPASVTAIANYLAGLGVATTTTAAPTTTTAAATTTTSAATTTTAVPTTTTVATTTTTTSGGGSGASDAAVYCTGCHNGLTVNGVAVGGGARDCPQRSVAEWTSTIDRMNGKGCGVPPASVTAIANYLAGLGVATTTIATTTTTTGGTNTTVPTTTSTTLAGGCPINGTTNYKYSGRGTCHGHDSHEVRDEKWCKQHMDHFNSKGNHTHSYPHPTCN